MINFRSSSEELDMKISKKVIETFEEVSKHNLSQESCLCSDLAPNVLPIGLSFSEKKFKGLIGYLVILHYYPLEPSLFCYMVLDLTDYFGSTDFFWLSALSKREIFLKYLVSQEYMTEQQFFSGIVNVRFLSQLIISIKLRFEEKLRKPRRVIRRKGYRDKGSLGSISSRTYKQEMSSDFYTTTYQYLIEEKQRIKSEETKLLELHLSEGKVISDELKVKFRLLKPKEEKKIEEENRISPEKDYFERRAALDNTEKDRETYRNAEELRIEAIESEERVEKFNYYLQQARNGVKPKRSKH